MSNIYTTIATLSPEKRQLLELLLKEEGLMVSRLPIPVQRRDVGLSLPLSFAQQRMWFLNQLDPDSAAYNMPAAVRIVGPLRVNALEQALNEIVSRHEILRTTFILVKGRPIQAIAETLKLTLPLLDLRSLSQTERKERASQLATEEVKRPFHLTEGPLLRPTLFWMGEDEYILLVVTHHIISDGWSHSVLVQELMTLYEAFSAGKVPSLPTLPIQYADFAHWQQELLQDEALNAELSYWLQHLHDAPAMLELPTDHPRPPIQTYRGRRLSIELPRMLAEALRALGEQEGATLFMTLLAAFKTLLYRYTGQEDIVVGTPIANRNRLETERLIGFFVNTLVLRTDLSGNPSFRELVRRVREVALEAYTYQDLPFEKLVEKLEPERSLSHAPLFQVAFILENVPVKTLELSGLILTPLEIETETAKFDLTLNIAETEQGLAGTLEYNNDLFEAATMTRLLGHFRILLESIVAHPEWCLSDLQLLPETEHQQLVVEWNDTQIITTARRCVHTLFEDQVEQAPDAVAVIFEDELLTYQQLNHRANRLAHHLRTLGVGPEVIVGVCMEPCLEMLVGLLGILKAGGAYIPLDPAYPKERLAFMLADANVTTLLTQQRLLGRLPEYDVHMLCLDSGWERFVGEHDVNPISGVTDDNIAYIIYTSGSTGAPKGVLLKHRGLSNLVAAQIRAFGIKSENRTLQFATLSFDASVWEIFVTLVKGATLHLVKQNSLLSGSALTQLLREQAITTVTLPPSVLATLPVEELPTLQTLISAGEPCSGNLASLWAAGRRFFNAYGPTEATVCATIAECSADKQKLPIGQPIANTQVYLLDSHLQPVPIGVPGELYISGEGLARGYLHQPGLTAERFIPNPFSSKPGMCMYRTGDRARYLPDGNIEYLNRIDHQVKVRGLRIELGEIESVLGQHPAVQDVAVMAREDIPGDRRVVAYVVPRQPATSPSTTDNSDAGKQANLPEQELRAYLRKYLPEYMIPSAFVLLGTLPLMRNGKVDWCALPSPHKKKAKLHETFVAPRTPLELRIVRIWEELLGVSPIGVTDNFFDLGGHSLLAAHLVAQIEKEFGQCLSLSVLFLAGTVEAMAQMLQQGGDSASWSPLVPLQSAGPKLPFFIVHPAPGTVFCYLDLARQLGTDQPVYGLQARGLDGEHLPLGQVKDMASSYIEALRSVQSQGPYLLGGHSFGGIVAFEMAQQLHEQGDDVLFLAILDTIPPIFAASVDSIVTDHEAGRAEDLVGLAMVMERFFGKKLSVSYNDLQHLAGEEQVDYLLKRLQAASIIPMDAGRAVVQGLLRVHNANSQAYNTYTPAAYPGRITLFRAKEVYAGDYDAMLAPYLRNPTFGWDAWSTQAIDVFTVPGNHISMLTQPSVQILAEQLRRCLDEAAASVNKGEDHAKSR